MARAVEIIQQEIRELTLAEKEAVLATLLEEMDGPPEEGVEAAWLAEAERRGQEIDSGTVQCVPSQEVFAKIDRILGK
jgi:hypothetical protein